MHAQPPMHLQDEFLDVQDPKKFLRTPGKLSRFESAGVPKCQIRGLAAVLSDLLIHFGKASPGIGFNGVGFVSIFVHDHGGVRVVLNFQML